MGKEALRIIEAGGFPTPAGEFVDIGDQVRRAAAGTRSYAPESTLPSTPRGGKETRFEVTNESTLCAARRLVAEGLNPAALNFASARHPGGGFLSGARAQEESLCRSSALYACLVNNPMYALHRARSDAMYTHHVIYSPDVPVFRDDYGELLADPYFCSFLTCPAVNAKVVLERDPSRGPAIRAAMGARIERVLQVSAVHGHDTLILGAWGCGVFGNDCRQVAELFHHSLTGGFQGAFARVVFAVLDSSSERRFIQPFFDRFGV
jgi:uncharacterized protein (TIGR02452 family)